MITEQALLSVRAGAEGEFEAAFSEARSIIASMDGFHGLRLLRGIESPSTYLLLVEWDVVADHEAFRASGPYQEWRALLHHFYDPFPVVEHYSLVAEVGDPG